MVRHSPHGGTRSSFGGVTMVPTAELLVVETTRSAACPKQLSTKRYRRERKEIRRWEVTAQGPKGFSFVFSIFLDFCLRFQIFLLT